MRFSFNYIWIYGGVLGLLIFLGLYHSFSIYGAATIDYSRESIADKSIELWQELGLYSDSLEVYVYQYQNKKLYDYLNETHDEILSPVQIKNNYHALTGWFVILMHKVDDFTMSGPNNFYRDYGVSRIIYDNSGRILRLSLKNSLPVDSLSQKKTLR